VLLLPRSRKKFKLTLVLARPSRNCLRLRLRPKSGIRVVSTGVSAELFREHISHFGLWSACRVGQTLLSVPYDIASAHADRQECCPTHTQRRRNFPLRWSLAAELYMP